LRSLTKILRYLQKKPTKLIDLCKLYKADKAAYPSKYEEDTYTDTR